MFTLAIQDELKMHPVKAKFEEQFGALSPRELIVAMRCFYEGLRDALHLAKSPWRGNDPHYLARHPDLQRGHVMSEFYRAGFASRRKFIRTALTLG